MSVWIAFSDLKCRLEYSLLALLYTFVLLTALGREGWLVRSVFRNKLLMGLGTVAYGTYLLHDVLLMWFESMVASIDSRPNLAVRGITAVIAMAVAVLVANVSWRVFEKPLVRAGHVYKY